MAWPVVSRSGLFAVALSLAAALAVVGFWE